MANGKLGDALAGHNLLDQWRDSQVQQAGDTMTARQVDERRKHSIQQLTEEWRIATKAVTPLMLGEVVAPPSLPPFVGFILVNDLVVHETDVRATLSLDRAPATPTLSLALTGYSFSLENRIRLLGLPSLMLVYDGKRRRLGGQGSEPRP